MSQKTHITTYWEDFAVGQVRDLGTVTPTREETIALWEEVSGKSAADLEWYEDFTHLKMSCTGVRLDQMRGTAMSDPERLAVRLKVA